MSLRLDELIDEVITRKLGNKEFALFYVPAHGWAAEIGNPSNPVNLGEVNGEFYGRGPTMGSAVLDLLDKIDSADG